MTYLTFPALYELAITKLDLLKNTKTLRIEWDTTEVSPDFFHGLLKKVNPEFNLKILNALPQDQKKIAEVELSDIMTSYIFNRSRN